MTPRFLARRDRSDTPRAYTRKPKFFRLGVEPLEERLAPSAGLPPDLIVGRTQSAYSAFDVANNSLTVTYTVYNQRAEDVSGILLTTSLRPGVTFAGATRPTDRDGPTLAWGLGTLPAFGRASVTVTMSLPAGSAITLDTGARAFGTLNGAGVSADTPVAALTDRALPASFLASTPDANTSDPFVQEQAARLRYDPQMIFNYLNDEVGYESYAGSLRGARGMLWGEAGNSLDEASLGIALFRASGIPARYAHGVLSDPMAKQLIISMFPAGDQLVGSISPGGELADPANDPQLLAETRDHYWVQFDSGGGFQNADSSGLPGGGIGTAFTTVTDTFGEVADGLRHKSRITVDAEIYNTATALFGFSDGRSTTTVLSREFNSVELVGRPITVGNFVQANSLGGLAFSSQTTTYSPYLILGDDAFPATPSNVLESGTSFQELLTNFPFGSTILTGVFVNVDVTNLNGMIETHTHPLFDRIGPAARLTGQQAVTVDPTAGPSLTALNTATIGINSAPRRSDRYSFTSPVTDALTQLRALSADFANATEGERDAMLSRVISDFNVVLVGLERTEIAAFELQASRSASALARTLRLAAYADGPRVVIASTGIDAGTAPVGTISFRMNVLRSFDRVVVAPGQSPRAAVAYRMNRGLIENEIEGAVLPDLGPASTNAFAVGTTASRILHEALSQGIPQVVLRPGGEAILTTLPFAADVKARIQNALAAGLTIVIPTRPVIVNGAESLGWFQIDETTGNTIGVLSDGSHGAIADYAMSLQNGTSNSTSPTARFMYGYFAGAFAGNSFLIIAQFALTCVAGALNNEYLNYFLTLKQIIVNLLQELKELEALMGQSDPVFHLGFILGAAVMNQYTADPPLPTTTIDVTPFTINHYASRSIPTTASLPGSTSLQGTTVSPSLAVSGAVTVNWTSDRPTNARIASLSVAQGQVTDAGGTPRGAGAITATLAGLADVTVAGSGTFSVQGTGNVQIYGPADDTLGLSAAWDNYTAAVNGTVSLTLTVPDGVLTVGGTRLPAGTYTIATAAATFGGRGNTSSPSFAGTATVTATNATVNVGPAGNAPLNGIDLANGGTFTEFTGTLGIEANGGDNDHVSWDGSAANVLTVSPSRASVSADHNTAANVAVSIRTNLVDAFTLSAEAPKGWSVSIDATGQLSIKPAPGLQTGTYAVRVMARSTANPELVSQSIVNVTVNASQPGIAFSVEPDPLFTVPFNGAQIPSSFRGTIRNLGPFEDTFALTFTNLPTGFDVIASGNVLTVPAGETSLRGLYLRPNGTSLPAPGTVVTFTVTATSTTDPTITQSQTVTYTVPEIRAVVVTNTPLATGAIPGGVASVSLHVQNGGNTPVVMEWGVLAATGLTVTGLPGSTSLAAGEATSIPLSLTVSESVALNTNLRLTIRAVFGSNPDTERLQFGIPLRVAVPGADAIIEASAAAQSLGNPDLANRLNDLGIALTTLVQSPTSDVARSQSLAALDAVIGLVGADAYLASLVTSLASDRTVLQSATTAATVQAAVSSLGATLEDVGQTLADAVAHRFTLAFVNNTGVAQPLAPSGFSILLRNTGTQTTTYDLTPIGVPAGVMAAFSQTSVTLAPGQSTFTAGNPNLTVTLTPGSTELTPFAFEVRAVARTAPAIAQSISGSLSVRSEVVTVVSVSPTPAFADPGVPVAVSARLLNAVNREQVATVQYTVRNAGGTPVFTSVPVTANLTVLTSLSTVALGTLNTTGFTLGNYTISVTVSDDRGTPIPGATGTGHLLIGSPVTADLGVDPTALPPGTGTVTNTLTIASSTAGLDPPRLVGVAPVPDADDVVRNGDFVYVASSAGVSVFNIAGANLANPQFIRSIGTSALRLAIRGNLLVTTEFDGSNGSGCRLNTFSLTDPANPTLLGTALIPYGVPWNFVITDTHVIMVAFSVSFFLANNDIFRQTGAVVAINIADPSAPFLDGDAQSAAGTPAGRDGVNDGVLFNDYGTSSDGVEVLSGIDHSGGARNTWDIVRVAPTIVLVTGSSSTGTDTQTGVGLVHVIDIGDPRNMRLIRSLELPGTVHGYGIAVHGTVALITATGGWNDFTPGLGLGGHLALAALDVGDPANPRVLGQEQLSLLATDSYTFVAALGGGLFATGGGVGTQSRLLLVDANDPTNLLLAGIDAPADILGIAAGDGLIFTADGSSLIIYQTGPSQAIPATARVTIPTADGVTVVPGSFSLTPTRTLPVAGGTSYEWDLSLSSTTTITWQSTVTNIQPGRSRTVAQNGSVSFVSQGTAGEVELADQFVTGVQILGLTPASQTAAPGEAVTFGVVLDNPTGASVTYTLGVAGVPTVWVDFPSSALVPANGSVTVPLTLTADAFAALAEYGLTITATAGTVTSNVQGTLTLAGSPVMPDPDAHGVVVALTATNATAGPGTTATFVVRVTNTGSTTETYDLTTSLPSGVTGVLSQTSVTVPPGAGNFREIILRLTPAAGTTPGDFNFTVMATAGTVGDLADALLTVVNRGVTVSLDRTTLAPGESATATITNTGSVADSFDLSLTGPAGLVSTLGVLRMDLAPGESRTVPVTTNATVPFAIAGTMPLSVVSQSVGNAAVRGSASANVNVPQSVGLTAAFRQASRVIAAPGSADFVLDVSNLGTGEDAFEATIFSSTGTVSAVLIGPDSLPAASVPAFRIPGLSQATITVRANLAAVGTGNVTVRIRSLTDPTRETVRTATLGTTATTRPTPLLVGGATNGTAKTYSPTNGQFGPGTALTFFSGFAGDVRTATADVTGDGIDDFIGGSGPGMVAEIAIIDGATNQVIARFHPYESTFRMGVFVAAADLNGDGKADVVVTPDLGGGPVVAVYDGSKLAAGLANGQDFGQPAQIVRYYGIENDPNFRGGARPALGDVNGDGTPDLMVSAGFLGGPRIALFNGVDVAAADDTPRHLIPDFYAFESSLRNGAFVALGDITGDGRAELVFGGGPTGGNRVRVFDAAALLAAPAFTSLDEAPGSAQLNNFFTGDSSLRGGARVAVKPLDDSGKAALITGSGNGESARVQVYSAPLLLATPTPAAPDQVILPFDAVLANGAFVG